MNAVTKKFYDAQDWAHFKNYWDNHCVDFNRFVELVEEDFTDTLDEDEDIPSIYRVALAHMLSLVDWEAIAKKIIE